MWVILLYVKKRIFAVLLCLFLLVPMPAQASTSAQSAVVMDAAGHTVLYERNAYEERLIDIIGALDKERQMIQVSIAVSP